MAHANTHRGYNGMIQQVWWEEMNKDIREKLRNCDPCQCYAKTHKQDSVEVTHINIFNIFPGHTLHLDFVEYNNRDHILIVDRLTGYIAAEHMVNQGTEAATVAVKNWANRFGVPYKTILYSGGGFRSSERVTKLHLDEMVFGINSTTSQEATGSANDRFMGRSIRTLLPNSYNLELKTGELIEK